jgi:hypothetical protein
MVDWDRVEELRSKGWDWDKIAADPKVGFHPDASVREAGRALRGLYHRQRSREARRGEEREVVKPPSKEEREKAERKWTLVRICYLLVPVVGLWFTFAYLIPSPVGLVLPAIPYLALLLVVVAFLLLFGLFRSSGARWTKVYRSTVIWGVILGLIFSGLIALGGVLFGCPFLPPAAAGTTQPAPGWSSFGVSAWQESGVPVFFFYGSTWCPYCSASSWAMWKAVGGFGTVSGVSGASFGLSAEDQIPYVDLSSASTSSSQVALVVAEDTSGVTGTFPTTSNCVETAYVDAYSGSAIPFVVINGQFVHGTATGGGTLVDPGSLKNLGYSAQQVAVQMETANGSAWSLEQDQTWWMMSMIAKVNGATPANLASQPYYAAWANKAVWGPNTQSSVESDLAQLH